MLTICSTPKKWEGEQKLIQTNALRSWLRLGVDVLLIGDETGTAEMSEEVGCMLASKIDCTASGTPLVSSIFNVIQNRIHTQYAVYVNADIILTGKVLEAVTACAHLNNFLIVGERRNAEVKELINFDKWSIPETTGAGRRARDYFIYNKDMFANMPPFAVGRGKWDAWIVGDCLSKSIPVIDATKVITCVHQNHNFDHIPGVNIKRGLWGKKGPEYEYNIRLIPSGHPALGILKTTAQLTSDVKLINKEIFDTNKKSK